MDLKNINQNVIDEFIEKISISKNRVFYINFKFDFVNPVIKI